MPLGFEVATLAQNASKTRKKTYKKPSGLVMLNKKWQHWSHKWVGDGYAHWKDNHRL